MSKQPAKRSVSSFSDISELFAKETTVSQFEASFGDPVPLSIMEQDDALHDQDFPDPMAAQADCAGIIATIFDLLTDTRLDPLAPQITWGMVNSFHFVAATIESEEDKLAYQIREMARGMRPGEVSDNALEELQRKCQSLTEQREEVEAMCDYAAAMYQACSGRVWSPARGSKTSSISSASQINARDFLRARAEKRRDRYDPQGPIVVVSGPFDWHDWKILWDRLDLIHARIPHMVLVSTGGRTGVPAIVAAWAAKAGVPCVIYGLQGRGMAKAFNRNRDINKLLPVEAIICEGSGVQAHLYDLFNPKEGGRRVPTHVIMRAEQATDTPLPRAQRKRRARL